MGTLWGLSLIVVGLKFPGMSKMNQKLLGTFTSVYLPFFNDFISFTKIELRFPKCFAGTQMIDKALTIGFRSWGRCMFVTIPIDN